MTNSEFKAWFDGYLEGIGGEPTAEQSARIREKLREIKGVTVNAKGLVTASPESSAIYAHVGVTA